MHYWKGKYPIAGILLNYDDDYYSQGFAQINEFFRALTKDDILQPNKSVDDFRSSNTGVPEIGYKLYVHDIRHQQIFTASQPIRI